MADTAADIITKWLEHVPPEVSKEDVEKVVSAYFPKTHRFSSKAGSHWLFVEDPDLRLLEAQGFETGTLQGRLTFSLAHGKRVKAYQIQKLLDAIKIKEEFGQVMSEQAKQEKKK